MGGLGGAKPTLNFFGVIHFDIYSYRSTKLLLNSNQCLH